MAETDSEAPAGGSPYTRTLRKQIGPLPLWGWGVVAVAGVAVFAYMRRGKGGQGGLVGPFSYVPAGNAPGSGSGGGGGGGAGSGQGGGQGGSTGSGDGSGGGGGGGSGVPDPGPQARPPSTQTRDAAPTFYGADVDPATVGEGARFNTRLTAQGVEKVTANLTNMITEQLRAGATTVAGQGAGVSAINEATVKNLTRSGYTAAVVRGQVLAARDSKSFFNALPQAERTNLARLLEAQAKK